MILDPIPENARPGNPRWTLAYLNLAQGLVMAGAKAKMIERFTDLPHHQIKDMYKVLRGMDPPPGPIMQASAGYFALPGKYTSEAWRVESILFLGCYRHLREITVTPVQRGWLLLAAYNAYLNLPQKLYESAPVKRLDINQAYALLTYCGFMLLPNNAELQFTECPTCSIRYPVVAAESLDIQPCPVCTLSSNYQRLADQSARLAQKNTSFQAA